MLLVVLALLAVPVAAEEKTGVTLLRLMHF